MLAETVAPHQGDPLNAAKQRITIGPAPDWVVPCPFRMDFRPKQPGHVIHLLLCKQVHAETHETFVHTAMRLESIHAVQNEAQGRIAFDPRAQHFTLHWLKIHRGGAILDRTALNNIRCVQPEADGFASPNRLILMLMLEDVRPGDALDLCYTMKDEPLVMRDYCGSLFTLPEGASVGKFYFSARFDESRPLDWAASASDWEPVETEEDGETHWAWTRENFPGSRPEENTPPWHINYPWIQVSDCPDWETVASAFAEAWNPERAVTEFTEIPPEIAAGGSVSRQTEKAIQWVQDQFRYLPLDEEMDGHPPTAPGVVSRRRYGDGKDLSLLLMVLLKRLGLEARLMLVNTSLRKSVASMLPMASLFDHLVIEYKARGEIRWVDATAKGQGGGSLNRVIRDFGVGLPVARAGADLVAAPAPAVEANIYRIKESVLLDTSGASSIFGIVIMARGIHAENLRREFETQGAEAMARQRLQMCVDRFIDVKRIGALEYRDNRTENEFFMAEVFEIKNFLTENAKTSWYNMELSAEVVANLLPLPISGSRQTPYGLPHPCQVVHILEVYCVALPPAVVQQRTIENPWLQFTRFRKTLAGNWTVTTTLSTLTDAIPPERIDEYREAVREIRSQSTWSLLVPAGQDRPHQRSDFGKLPASWDASAVAFPRPATTNLLQRTVPSPAPHKSPLSREGDAQGGAVAATTSTGAPGETRYRRRKRHRRRHRRNKRVILLQAALVASLAVVLLLMAVFFFRKTGGMLKPPPLPPTLRGAQ